ncbi:MAG: hypothetical protein JWN98_1741 [Abditibacteriota bacterium]|nr:hypothetical protein [Abditibacteriota bacterium]
MKKTSKTKWMAGACGVLMSLGGTVQAQDKSSLRGDYIEARSASVYAGPCHYSNEAVTEGRNATMAWRFTSGAWNNVDLSGLSAVAVVMADDNLAQDEKTRRSVLYLDARATAAQTAALRDLFAQKFAAILGKVTATRAVSTQVTNDGLNFSVRAGQAVSLDVNRYACKHCTQDAQIWYQPLAAAENVLVGKTVKTIFRDAALERSWNDAQEANSAFVGTFAW